METQASHTMQLAQTLPTGVEEWACPTCGRRIQLDWETVPERVVLQPGDDRARHVCGKGGLQLAAEAMDDEAARLLEQLQRGPFGQWLDQTEP